VGSTTGRQAGPARAVSANVTGSTTKDRAKAVAVVSATGKLTVTAPLAAGRTAAADASEEAESLGVSYAAGTDAGPCVGWVTCPGPLADGATDGVDPSVDTDAPGGRTPLPAG